MKVVTSGECSKPKTRTYPCLVSNSLGIVWLALSPKQGTRLTSLTGDTQINGSLHSGNFSTMNKFEGTITLSNE